MPTKPRGFYTLEQRDALITEMHDNQLILIEKLDNFLEIHEKCQVATCKRFEKGEEDFGAFRRDYVKSVIGMGVAIIGALITGLFAIIR